MGEGSPLYDPGPELYYWEGESSASITINGMGQRKEVNCIAAAVTIRYPSKLHRSTRSGPTALHYAIGPCTTSLITGQYEMIVTSLTLLNFLVSGGFLYPRTPAEPIESRDAGLSKGLSSCRGRSLFMVPRWRLHSCSGLVVCVLLGSHVLCACWPCGCRWVSPRHEQVNRIFPKKNHKISRRWEFPPTRYFGMCEPRILKISQQPGVV